MNCWIWIGYTVKPLYKQIRLLTFLSAEAGVLDNGLAAVLAHLVTVSIELKYFSTSHRLYHSPEDSSATPYLSYRGYHSNW